jgi:hypothetical protein
MGEKEWAGRVVGHGGILPEDAPEDQWGIFDRTEHMEI